MKKILVSLLLVVALVSLTACGKKEDKKEEQNTKEVVINDEGFGKTTLAYNKDLDYKVDEAHDGKYMDVIISSENENFEFELYHFDISETGYNLNKENRKNQEGYKEYKWNGLEGYVYNVSNDSTYINILLKNNDGQLKALFGSLTSINYNTANIPGVVESDNFQKLLNSIKFSE